MNEYQRKWREANTTFCKVCNKKLTYSGFYTHTKTQKHIQNEKLQNIQSTPKEKTIHITIKII